MKFLTSEDTLKLKFAAQDLVACSQQKTLEIREKIQATIDAGGYNYDEDGEFSEIVSMVNQACQKTMTILPEDPLRVPDCRVVTYETEFQVRRRTALEIAKELLDSGNKPLVLSFADGLQPGVTPRFKERTQEELNCRSSALLKCLQGSAMYSENRKRGVGGEYSSTCILSPGVPVFMKENGQLIRAPFLIDFISCAAPMKDCNQTQRSIDLLRDRITRILEIAKAYQYKSLVLGAWGCGGCGNDPAAVAFSFFQLFSTKFEGDFEKVCFAIADPTENPNDVNRGKYIEPFKDFFCETRKIQIKRLSNARSFSRWLADWTNLARQAIARNVDQNFNDQIIEVLRSNHELKTCYPKFDTFLAMNTELKKLVGQVQTEIKDAQTTITQIQKRNPYATQQLISTEPLRSLQTREIIRESGFKINEAHQIPSRSASYGMVPESLHGEIRSKLLEKFPGGLYEHQTDAMRTFLDGKDLCLATSTASGKSLIFMALAADHLIKNPNSRVIAVYPQRALTQDQLGKWESFLDGTEITVGLIDGSVKTKERLSILEKSRVVVMTPDVIHSWMMRFMIDTRSKLQQVGLLILDECHLYTEILGTNLAYLLRRMHCVSNGEYRMIAATATVGDPAGMISKLTGRDTFEIIGADAEKSPAPEKNLLLVQYDQSNLTREQRDFNLVAKLADHYDGKFLVFVDSRQRVERIAAQAASNQVTSHGVLPYRSGYEAADRRAIQTALSAGNLKGVITTSALEVGVDIGDIDLVVILGYPPSVKSFWQRFGRAGRRADRRCDCVVVDTMGIMATVDGGIAEYMKKPAEESLFYMDNRFLRYGNVLCAASELSQIYHHQPLPDEGALNARYIDLPPDFAVSVLNELVPNTAIPAELRDMKPTENTPPQLKFSLRQVMEEQYLIRRKEDGAEVEQLSASQRFREAYPGAIFRHRRTAYRITTRKLGRDMLELIAISPQGIDGRKTKRIAKEWIIPDFHSTRFLKKSITGYAVACNIQIEERVFGFKEEQSSGVGPIDDIEYNRDYPYQNLPLARIIETTGVVISLPEDITDSRITEFLMEGFSTISGISMRNIGIGSVSNPQCPFFKKEHRAICIYDDVQGGFRLTEDLVGRLEDVAKRAALIAADCDNVSRDAFVRILKDLERHFSNLREVQVGTGYRGEALEISRQEDSYRLVVRPGQNVVLFRDPDKREYVITEVFLGLGEKILYRNPNGPIPHEDIMIIPGHTILAWYDPDRGVVLPDGQGPDALAIQSIQFMQPAYRFKLRSMYAGGDDYERMVPMEKFGNGDLVLIYDPRMPNGYGLGKWCESTRKNGDSTVLSCRLRSLDPQSFDDIWSGEFSAAEKPEFGWWAVQRA
jgi:DEAD/DEAH box helicase domain-containing protein